MKGQMTDNTNVLEPPRDVGCGKPVVESCIASLEDYDDAPKTPLRMGVSNAQSVPTTLIKPNKVTKIATFNVRTLKDNWRLSELVNNMQQHDISLIGIQEHRRVHEEEIKFDNFDKHHLITSSAWRNKSQAATGGVGLVLNRDAESNLSEVTSISKRILKADFSGNPAMTVIVAYAPTNEKKNLEETTKFYLDLRRAIDTTPPHNLMIILGDLNAKLSSRHMKHSVHARTNDNGALLAEMIDEKLLFLANDKFNKKHGKRWTFEDPKGGRHLLDYIIVNRKWRNNIVNCEAYSSFASVGSDHRILTMSVKMSLRVTKSPVLRKRYDWKCLRHNPVTLQKFSIDLRNKFNELYNENDNINEQYSALVDANQYAAENALPLLKSGKKELHANNPVILLARKNVDKLAKRYNINKSRRSKKQLLEAQRKLQAEYIQLESEQLESQLQEAEVAFLASNTNKAWKLINTITNRKSTQSGKLKGKSPADRTQQWFEHFKNLLGSTATPNSSTHSFHQTFSNLNIPDDAFNIDELRTAKKQIREGKAPGEDGIMPEVIKRCDIDDIILKFSNKLLIDGVKPDTFTTLNITPIPKSGDLSVTNNYRGISLTSLSAKLINRMILNRIRPIIDPLLRDNQNGFRPRRSATTSSHSVASSKE